MFRRKRKQGDFVTEIESHLDLETERLQEEGLSEEEARMAARRAFGNVTRAEERFYESSRWLWWDHFMQDVRFSLRTLRKSPGFTAVAVLTLALGIGANTAIFSLIDAVTLRMLPVVQPNELRLVLIADRHKGGEGDPEFTNTIWEQLRDHQDVFSGVFAWSDSKLDVAKGGAVHNVNAIWVSGEYFHVLGLRPAAGRMLTAADDQRGCRGAVVLSYGFWQEHYGGAQNAVGTALSLNTHPFEVVGVAPPGFSGMRVGRNFDVALPICAVALLDGKNSRLDDRSYWWLSVAGRTRSGISSSQLAAGLDILSTPVFTAALPGDWPPDAQKDFLDSLLVTSPASTGVSELRKHFDRPLETLMVVVGLVLLIACANMASLLLARGASRQKDLAVRQALGASRFRLIRQLLTECILLSMAGALAGTLFARWGAMVMIHVLSTARSGVFLDLSLDDRVLGFTVATAVFTSLLFGLLPALRATRVTLASAMKAPRGGESKRSSLWRGRHGIVALQLALSLVLLVTAGLFLRSFEKLATLDLGFDRSSVLMIDTDLKTAKVPPERQMETYDAIERRLRAVPGVLAVGRSVISPVSGQGWNGDIHTEWSKALVGRASMVWFNCASPGFFDALRTTLLAGRYFNEHDTKTASPVAIIDQTLARRFFPNLDPVGRILHLRSFQGKDGPPIEVVGVVKDFKYSSPQEEARPVALFPDTQVPFGGDRETLELRTGVRPSALISAVQAAVASVNKDVPLEFYTLATQVDDSMVQERMLAMLSAFFGALALLLATVGLYGTLSYVVAQRQTEFGIRMALGAEPASILRMVMRSVVTVLVSGTVAGLGISLATTRVLQQLLFGLSARDAGTIAGAVIVLGAVALIAGYFPARRATRVDPMVALRDE
jgi:putative ABC transport system permease protein